MALIHCLFLIRREIMTHTGMCRGGGPPEIQKVATSVYKPRIAGNTRSWGRALEEVPL